MEIKPAVYSEYVHKGLKIRFAIYLALTLLLVAILIYRVIDSAVDLSLPLIGFGLGIIVGIIVTRIYKISWDEYVEQVIFRLDVYSIVLLILYILFEIFREKIVEHFVNGPAVALTSFALLAGALAGRVVGIRRKIRTTIEENI
jgi:hypothetical protein